MRCLARSRELDDESEQARVLGKEKISSLEVLLGQISGSIDKMKETLGEARSQELSKKIVGFSSTVFDQTKDRITEETEKQVQQLIADSKSEKTKTLKNLEAFLATSPFTIVDRSIDVEKKEAAYGAVAKYRCQDDIEYEFSLDTKASPFFRSQLSPVQFDRSLKLPIGFGKSWLKKDPVPDFEHLDEYVVKSAEATETNLIAEFVDPQKDSTVRGVYSRQGTHTSLSLHYTDVGKSIDISADPNLNANLDSDSFVRVMEKLWLATNDLEERKISLVRLSCDGKDVLEGLQADEFIQRAWKVVAPRVKNALKESSSGTDSKIKLLGEPFDVGMVMEKLKSLGDQANEIAFAIGLSA
jgi:hypothetical protein